MFLKKWIKVLSVFLSIGILSADWDLTGQITAIDPAAKVITIGGWGGSMNVQVLPYTELEGEDCGLFGLWDSWGSFKDLYVGQIVEIDLLQGGHYPNVLQNGSAPASAPMASARKIEWKCGRRAY